MAEDLKELEQRLERELARWDDPFRVACPEQTRARVRDSVRLELNSDWLPEQTAPGPTNHTVQRVRQRVREELAGTGRTSSRRRGWIWAAGSVAAAVALAVGAAWHVRQTRDTSETDPGAIVDAPKQEVDPVLLFAEAADQLWSKDSLVEPLRSDVRTLEQQVRTRSDEDGFQDMLDQIDGRIESIFDQWPAAGDDSA